MKKTAHGALPLVFMLLLQHMAVAEENIVDEVFEPEVIRRSLWFSDYDTETWEISGYLGSYSFAGFDAQFLSGIKLAWHANSWFYLVADAGISAVDDTGREAVGLPSLVNNDSVEIFNLSAGLNLLHGQVFVRREWAFESEMYVTAGVGRTLVNAGLIPGSSVARNTVLSNKTFSFGYRVFLSDWVTVYSELQVHLIDFGLTDVRESDYNYAPVVGFSFFF